MAPTHPARRPSAGARRAGYGLAIVFSTALLVILNGSPGWQAIPFPTSDTAQVLWLVNLSLAAGIAATFVYLAYDPPWLKSLGDLITTAIGLAAAIRIWQVFPFDLSAGWSLTVRALLVVCIDNACQPRDNTAGASLVAEHASAACAAPAACGIVRAGS